MRTMCLCAIAAMLVSGCATTGKVDQMIDAKLTPQVEQIQAQFDAQTVAAAETLEDLKSFMDRIGRAVDSDVDELQSELKGISAQLSSIKADVAGTDGDVSAVEAKLQKLDASISALSGQIDMVKSSVSSSLAAVKADVADAAAKADAAAQSAARLATGK